MALNVAERATSRKRSQAVADQRVYVGADKARDSLGDLLDDAGFRGKHVVISRNGKLLAALVSIADLEKIEAA